MVKEIKKNQYYTFKEYPNKDNIINQLSGTYATYTGLQKTAIYTSEVNGFEKIVSDSYPTYYKFPNKFVLSKSFDISSSDKIKYNRGFTFDLYVLKARYKTVLNLKGELVSDEGIEYYNASTNTWGSATTLDCYTWITNGSASYNNGHVNVNVEYNKVFNDPINAIKSVSWTGVDQNLGGYSVKTSPSSITYVLDNAIDVGIGFYRYVQEYCDRYYIVVYGNQSLVDYNDNFTYNNGSNTIFEQTIPNNELLNYDSYFKTSDTETTQLSVSMCTRIFNRYQNGCYTAELEWIGDPSYKIGDIVRIEGNNRRYLIKGKSIKSTGGYSETLYLIDSMSYTLNISTDEGQDYIVLKNGVQVYDGEQFTQFDRIVIPYKQSSDYVTIDDVRLPLEPYVGNILVDSLTNNDISIYFSKSHVIIG